MKTTPVTPSPSPFCCQRYQSAVKTTLLVLSLLFLAGAIFSFGKVGAFSHLGNTGGGALLATSLSLFATFILLECKKREAPAKKMLDYIKAETIQHLVFIRTTTKNKDEKLDFVASFKDTRKEDISKNLEEMFLGASEGDNVDSVSFEFVYKDDAGQYYALAGDAIKGRFKDSFPTINREKITLEAVKTACPNLSEGTLQSCNFFD